MNMACHINSEGHYGDLALAHEKDDLSNACDPLPQSWHKDVLLYGLKSPL